MTVEAAELTLTAPGPAPMPRAFPLVLRVEWDPNLLSANRTQEHWRVTHKKKVAARRQFGLAYDAAGRPVWNVPVVVDVVIRRARRMDETNARGALKCGEDVLFKNAITPDDKPAWVAWGTVRQEIAGKWSGREECELTVWPREVLERREQALEEVLSAAWEYEQQFLDDEDLDVDRLLASVRAARELGWRPNER